MAAASASRVWFITGCSSGIGRSLAQRVVDKGHRLAATARNLDALEPLVKAGGDRVLPLAVDVTKHESVTRAVDAAAKHFGRLDVVCNNAGFGLVGALEEYSLEQIERNVATNLLGPLFVIRAAAPVLRQQRSGVILNINAIAGFSNEIGFSVYGGAKAALNAAADSVAGELAPFGVKVINAIPGPFRTNFIARGLECGANRIADYDATSGKFAHLASISGKQPGDPDKLADVVIAATELEKPPAYLFLGKFAFMKARKHLASLGKLLDEWEPLAGAKVDF
jgi:NAD(P)-dependent dehydrogenase (short-subunit alcohol dehydrogenase family)